MTGPATAALELRDVAKSFGAVVALRSGSLAVDSPARSTRWSGENGAGKSTLVKIVAGVHRRDAGVVPAPRRGRRLRLDRRVQGRRHRRDLPGADALPGPLGHREHLHGPPAAGPRRAASTGPRCTPRRPACSQRLGVAHRPAPPGPRPLHRRPADHRDRQGHLARRQRPGHGRADRGAQRRRGRPAVRGRPQPARRGPRPGLHLAPLRRGLRPLRHGHRDARRRVRLHRRRRRDHRRRRSSSRMVGREVGDLFPKTAAEIGDVVLEVDGLSSTRHLPRHLASPSAPARSSAWPAWSAPAAARSPGPSSASTSTTPARVRLAGPAVPRRSPPRGRSGPAWRSSPRTAASRAWSPRAPSPATSPA